MEGSEGPLICQMGVSGHYRLCKSAGCGEAEALSVFSRDGRGVAAFSALHAANGR